MGCATRLLLVIRTSHARVHWNGMKNAASIGLNFLGELSRFLFVLEGFYFNYHLSLKVSLFAHPASVPSFCFFILPKTWD